MIRHRLTLLIAGALLAAPLSVPLGLVAAPAAAQTGAGRQGLPTMAPETAVGDGPRFAFAPVEGGTLKLDTRTGLVSICAKGPAGFACEAVPDSRDAYEAEIARLQQEIAALKAGRPGAAPMPAPGDPSELDAALDYAERMYSRLKAFIDRLRTNEGQEPL